jgi:phosphoglycolate phosphatase
MIKGLLFDKDGTLFDFAHTWENWAAKFLVRVCEGDVARAALIGADIGFDLNSCKFSKDSIVIAGTANEITLAMLPHFPGMTEQSMGEMLNDEAEKAPQMEAVPLVPLLTGLRGAGYKLGVATNDAERPARTHLSSVDALALFDFIAGWDSGYGGKPETGQLLAFAKAVDLEPAQVAMVGDSTHDLHAGRAAGMVTVAVLTGMADHTALAPHADVVLPDIGHLPAWLSAQSNALTPSGV